MTKYKNGCIQLYSQHWNDRDMATRINSSVLNQRVTLRFVEAVMPVQENPYHYGHSPLKMFD